MLTARKLVQSKLRDVENSLRGILRGFGLKVGKTTPRTFAARIRELVAGHANLQTIARALLSVRTVLLRELDAFEKQVRCMGARGCKGQAVDVDAGCRADRGAHLCIRHRRSGAVQIVETSRATFRAHAEEVSVRRDRSHRPDQQDRGRLGAHRSLPGRPRHADQASQGLPRAQELGDADRQASRAIARRRWRWRANSRWSCIACSPMRQRLTPPLSPRPWPRQPNEGENSKVFGRVTTPAFPKRSPFAGTMDRSGRHPGCGIRPRH
jgi:hypothetical protein